MKTIQTMAICLLIHIQFMPAQKITLIKAIPFGNNSYNQGFSVDINDLGVHMIARNQGALDLGIGESVVLNGPSFTEHPVFALIDGELNQTQCANLLAANNMSEHVIVLRNDFKPEYGNAISGLYNGIITRGDVDYKCLQNQCGFAARVDEDCDVTEFAQFSASGGASAKALWDGNFLIVAVNYTGTIEMGGNTFTSQGFGTDALIAKSTSFGEPYDWVANISGAGYEGIASLDYTSDGGLVFACYTYANPDNAFTYSDPLGTNTTISYNVGNSASVPLFTNEDLVLTGNIIIPSQNGLYDIKDIYKSSTGNWIIGGTFENGTLYPDINNPGLSISTSHQVMCFTRWDEDYHFNNHYIPDPDNRSIMTRFRKNSFDNYFFATGTLEINFKKSGYPNGTDELVWGGIMYFINENLDVIESLTIAGAEGNCQFYGSDIDGDGNLYVTGAFSDSVDFDPSPENSWWLTGDPGYDIFLAKYDASVLSVNQTPSSVQLILSPVPSKDKVNIRAKLGHPVDCNLSIADFSGRIIYQREFGNTGSINESWSPSEPIGGIYMARLQTGNTITVRKFVLLGR